MQLRQSFAALLLLAASACASSPGDTPDNPIRIVGATQEQIMSQYPRDALERGVSGRATVECEIVAGGLLDHCAVLDENPTGYGFGDAAIQVAFDHRVRPDAQGRFPTGRHVTVPITFTPPG